MGLNPRRSARSGRPGKSSSARIEASSPPRIFFSVEVWTAGGLTRFAVLFVIHLATRRVEIAGIVREPDSAWVVQCGRHLTDPHEGCLRGKRFLVHDRDPRFTDAFADTLAAAGVETLRLPPRSHNLNAFA